MIGYTFSIPLIANATLIGPWVDSVTGPPIGHTYQFCTVQRRSSRMSVYNSVIGGYPWGMSLRDTNTKIAARDSVLIWGNVSMVAQLDNPTHIHLESKWPAGDAITPGVHAWFDWPTRNNIESTPRWLPDIGIVLGPITDPDPVPDATLSLELIKSADSTWAMIQDPFFERTTYRGAFSPKWPMWQQWTKCWTNFDPNWTDYLYIRSAAETPEAEHALLGQNYPSPFNPTTGIRFTVPNRGHVMLTVYSVKGERVATLINRVMDSGTYETSFSVKQALREGVGCGASLLHL